MSLGHSSAREKFVFFANFQCSVNDILLGLLFFFFFFFFVDMSIYLTSSFAQSSGNQTELIQSFLASRVSHCL